MKEPGKSTAKTIVVMLLFSIIAIAVYYNLSNRTSPLITNSETEATEVDTLISKDIAGNYPASPREVMKLFGRIVKSLHNDNLKEKQIKGLTEQLRLLLDDELLTNNVYEDQLSKLNDEISGFKSTSSTIMNYTVEENDSIKYWNKDNDKLTSLLVSYTLKENSNYVKITEQYILRQDTENRWKILGWKAVEQKQMDGEE
jgi:hypothetical protein